MAEAVPFLLGTIPAVDSSLIFGKPSSGENHVCQKLPNPSVCCIYHHQPTGMQLIRKPSDTEYICHLKWTLHRLCPNIGSEDHTNRLYPHPRLAPANCLSHESAHFADTSPNVEV